MDRYYGFLSGVLDLQQEHQFWLEHNFPGQMKHQPLLGLMEEVGELAHAHLKNEQSIRDMGVEAYETAVRDAIGDIFIYLLSYGTAAGYDVGGCIITAWMEVRDRDWKRFPKNGKDEG